MKEKNNPIKMVKTCLADKIVNAGSNLYCVPWMTLAGYWVLSSAAQSFSYKMSRVIVHNYSLLWELSDNVKHPSPSIRALVAKSPLAIAGDVRVSGSIAGLGRSPGGGHGHPLQCSRLENPMDRGAWRATVHRVAKSRTWLEWLSTH